jgi:hypothetical protein
MTVYSVLSTDPGVQAITDIIEINLVPEKYSLPFIMLSYVTKLPENMLEGADDFENTRVSVHCYADSQTLSVALYKACRAALKTKFNIISVNAYGVKDPSGEAYQTQFDVSQWG